MTTKRRVFIRWSEFERLAVADFEATGDEGSDCKPVSAEVLVCHGERHAGDGVEPFVIVHSDRCGAMAAYRPGLRADGSPFVQQVSRADGERCDRGHLLCCPGQHECSLCVNDLAQALRIDWEALADTEASWRRTVQRAKRRWQEGRAEIDRLEAAYVAPAFDNADPGHSSKRRNAAERRNEDTETPDSPDGDNLMGGPE